VITGGSYSWVIPTTTGLRMSYLANFYKTGLGFPQEKTVGATYKGFNDRSGGLGSKARNEPAMRTDMGYRTFK